MMGRVLINNTGSDWPPVPAILEFDIRSRANGDFDDSKQQHVAAWVVVRTGGGKGVKRGWFRHVTTRATCTRLSHGGWI